MASAQEALITGAPKMPGMAENPSSWRLSFGTFFYGCGNIDI